MRPLREGTLRRRISDLKGAVVGVGVTAYPRAGPMGLVPGYRIACIRWTGDLTALRRVSEVFCLEESVGRPLPEARDSTALLAHPNTREYLARLPRPVHLLLYQSTFEIEALAEREGWHLLANPAALRVRTADRAFFHRLADALGFPAAPGHMVSLERFLAQPYGAWTRELGPRLVVQLPDVLQGGGRSTFFLREEEDLERIKTLLRPGTWQGKRLRRVSVRAFVRGEPASVTGCVLEGRSVVTGLQRQIIDPPWAAGLPSSGVFGGHSWGGVPWEGGLDREARRMALAVARVLSTMGFLGVFGLDLLVDRSRGRVVPVEINPRLTGAFPVLTRLQASREGLPLEVLHLLAFLKPPIREDAFPEETGDWGSIRGAHLILLRGRETASRKAPPRAGLYEANPSTGRVRWIREAVDPAEISSSDQVILVDGPLRGEMAPLASRDPFERIGRLVFPGPVLTPDGAFRAGVLDMVEAVRAYLLP